MRTVTLGTSGAQVSALCLGAMFFGTRNDEATSFALLDQYVGAGGTFIDTANIYAHWVEGFQGGESEALLGRWLKARGNRNSIFLASKVGFNYPAAPRSLAARHIIQEAEKSLTRLGVDTLDLFYAHVDDYRTPLEETLEAFDRLVQTGKVRTIGASNYLAWRLEKARWISRTNGWAEYCCVQQRYSYLRGGARPASSRRSRPTTTRGLRQRGGRDPAGLFGPAGRGLHPVGPGLRRAVPRPGQRRAAGGAARRGGRNRRDCQPGRAGLDAATGRPAADRGQHARTIQENLGALDVALSDEQLARLNAAGA